jgi:hypothetical protein
MIVRRRVDESKVRFADLGLVRLGCDMEKAAVGKTGAEILEGFLFCLPQREFNTSVPHSADFASEPG